MPYQEPDFSRILLPLGEMRIVRRLSRRKYLWLNIKRSCPNLAETELLGYFTDKFRETKRGKRYYCGLTPIGLKYAVYLKNKYFYQRLSIILGAITVALSIIIIIFK